MATPINYGSPLATDGRPISAARTETEVRNVS